MWHSEFVKTLQAATDQYTGPNNVQTIMTTGSELYAKLKKNMSFVNLANEILQKCMLIMQNTVCVGPHCVQMEAAKTQLYNALGHRLVHHVLGKPDKVRGVFKSLHEIGHKFVQELATCSGQTIKSPFQHADTQKAPNAQDAPKDVQLFRQQTSAIQALATDDIKDGVHIKDTAAKDKKADVFVVTFVKDATGADIVRLSPPMSTCTSAATPVDFEPAEVLKHLRTKRFKVVNAKAHEKDPIAVKLFSTTSPSNYSVTYHPQYI